MDALQRKITIDGVEIWQPDMGLAWNYETTYTKDSTRVQSGEGHFSELFTVQSYGYKATGVPPEEVSKILQLVVGRKFKLSCFCPYYNRWMTDTFYVGKGSLSLDSIVRDNEVSSDLSFNMISLDPLPLDPNAKITEA